jgi:starch synthase
VVETVKKLGWAPDVIHCHGWFTSLMPLYIKRYYSEDPLFADARLVISVYEDEFPKNLSKKLVEKLGLDGFTKKDLKHLADEPNYVNFVKQAIEFADGVVQGSEKINPELEKFIKKTGKPFLSYKNETEYVDACNDFYDMVLEEVNV